MNRTIAKRIKALRLEAGLSLPKLSRAAGLPYSSLSNLEAVTRLPRADEIIALALFFNVTTDYILLGKELPKPVEADHSKPKAETPETKPAPKEEKVSTLRRKRRRVLIITKGLESLTKINKERRLETPPKIDNEKEVNSIMTKKGFKRARQALGKTQREMAKDLNLSESFIRHVENRRQLPSLENAVRISLYLGEPIETVFYDFSDVFSEYAKKFLRSS